MTSWQDVDRSAPEFAGRVRALFDAHKHKTIATLRADGSPRISGIEAVFEDGELAFGSMPRARKGVDLRRDARFALHSATVDPTEGKDSDRFVVDVTEVVHTHLNEAATLLVVEWWTPANGLRRTERE